jgi:hypothetical protein
MEEQAKDKEIKAFESAPWFRDELGFLGKKDLGKNKNVNPKALFNLDGHESYKTIHDRHKAPTVQYGTPPRSTKAPKKRPLYNVEDSKKDTSEDDDNSKGTGNTGSYDEEDYSHNRYFASQTSSGSVQSSGLGDKESRSKGSKR